MSKTFEEAEDTVVTFGTYSGNTIGDIADQDILYLDWLYGEMTSSPPKPYEARRVSVYEALKVYMEDSAVQDEVEEAMAERDFNSDFE